MLTLIKTPQLVALTGNPIRFTVHSDETTLSGRYPTLITLCLFDIGQEGDTIHLTYGDVDLTFTCMPSPDESGTQIPDLTCYLTIGEWVLLVVQFMLRNYYISRDWTITVSETSILMVGKDSNVSTPFVEYHWMASTISEPSAIVQSGQAPEPKLFYKIGLRVYIITDETETLISEDLLPVNPQGNAIFDIHTVFADYVYPEFQWPEISNDLSIRRTKSTAKYCIEYYEQYGNPIVPGALTRSTVFNALYGGVSKSQLAVYNRNDSSFWAKLTYNNYFLTWQPLVKSITPYQVEKLYFFCQYEMSHFGMRANFYYLDGSKNLSVPLTTIEAPPDKGVIEITITAWNHYWTDTLMKNLDYYEVWVDYRSERISELRTFKIDRNYYENTRYFLFLNSLGGYDTLRATGNQEDSLEYTRTDIDKTLPDSFEYMDHENATGFVKEILTYKANTGWINREQLSWLREFFLSKQVFQINGDKLMAVVVSSTKVLQRVDKEYLYSLEFEYRRSFESEFYSREITYQTFGDDFENDYPNE
jgi:hypothetical protein